MYTLNNDLSHHPESDNPIRMNRLRRADDHCNHSDTSTDQYICSRQQNKIIVRCPECGAQFQDGYIYHRMTSRVISPVLHPVAYCDPLYHIVKNTHQAYGIRKWRCSLIYSIYNLAGIQYHVRRRRASNAVFDVAFSYCITSQSLYLCTE